MSYEPYNPEVNFYPVNEPVKTGEGTPESPSPNSPATVPQTSQSNVVPTGGGSILNGGTLQSPNFVTGANGSGWKLDSNGNLECNDGNFRGDITGASGTFSGAVAASSLDIGGDDATSTHIDSDGNQWWGASIANKLTAPARINKDGTAYFTGVTTIGSEADGFNQIAWNASNMQVNGSYVTNNDIYGDGDDGNVTISGNTTLTSDMFYNNLTVDNGFTLNPNGFRIFVKGTLTNNGTISRNGAVGGNGTNATGTTGGVFGTGGTAGAALADGSIKGALAGVAGVNGVDGVARSSSGTTNGNNGTTGGNGTNVAKSIVTSDGISGVAGGNGGNGTTAGSGTGNGGTGGAAGSGGTRTGTVYNKIHNALAANRLYDDNGSAFLTAAPSNGSSGTGASGGVSVLLNTNTSASSGATGGSGASGSQGGIVVIFARKIINAGTISANGGAGGNAGTTFASSANDNDFGGQAAAGGSGGSSGGDGGNGGAVILVYSSLTNTGTIQAAGGTGGTGASGQAGATDGAGSPSATSGSNGSNGTSGNNGVVITLQV